MTVSIIIKALNEERHIARAIESALAALKAVSGGGEVILADSGSSDRTVAIAAAYPIRVVQLSRARDRGCGAGPQLGYQYATHPYLCLIDGDMVLHAEFLTHGLAQLALESHLAGVGGLVIERNFQSIEFKRRALRADPDLKPGAVDRLNGGGLYRRTAIESVGYLSDRNLHGYEEVELASRLRAQGWALHRLADVFVDHHGHSINGYALLWRRFRTGYIYGIGEILRSALGRSNFRQIVRDLPEIRLWLAVLAGWAMTLAVASTASSAAVAFAIPVLVAMLLIVALSVRKQSFALGLFAFASWNAQTLGFLIGFLRPRVAPTTWLASRVVADGTVSRSVTASSFCGKATGNIALAALAFLAASQVRPACAEWLAVRDTSLTVLADSAIDFSSMFPNEPAGFHGRISVGNGGHLSFADRPSNPVRFLCASLAWSPASGGYPDHAMADIYADQLRRHGYNAARFHFLDSNLMFGRKADFDLDPAALDHFRYLLSALKRNGIYWVIDAMTAPNGALVDEQHDLKLGVHLDAADRSAWLRFVKAVLGTPNPYTGSAPLADPALALVMLANENGLIFDGILNELRTGQGFPPALQPPFNAWLKDHYGSTAILGASWNDLQPGESLVGGTIALPSGRDARGPRTRDLSLFFAALQADTASWMTERLRELGYLGLVSAYNNGSTTGESFARAALPVITADVYHDEVDSLATPLTTTGLSSLTTAAAYVRIAMGVRRLDRPFAVTEYDHVFPNPFRYEAGAVFPAYAALQQWDLICRHAFGAIDLAFNQPWPHKRAILPYDIGLDPVGRAAETLAVLLFRRGDVAGANGTVAVRLHDAADLRGDGQENVPDDETELGLVSRFGLVSDAGSSVQYPIVLSASARAPHAEARSALERLNATVLQNPKNPADMASGGVQSDTGEITLNAHARSFMVVTPRTEAAAIMHLTVPQHLGRVTIDALSGPALVAVSALDDAPVASSRRLLVLFASNAQNTDMRFADLAHHVVTDFGRMPVQIERQKIKLQLQLDDASKAWQLQALHLDGAPGDAIPVVVTGNTLTVDIDNGASRHGPTTFFVLERGR